MKSSAQCSRPSLGVLRETTAEVTIQLTHTAQNELGCVTNLHLTCTSQKTDVASEVLAACKTSASTLSLRYTHTHTLSLSFSLPAPERASKRTHLVQALSHSAQACLWQVPWDDGTLSHFACASFRWHPLELPTVLWLRRSCWRNMICGPARRLHRLHGKPP